MSSTQVRIISGAVMVILVGLCLYGGPQYSLIAIALMGALTVDEIIVNFYQQPRTKFKYILAQSMFILIFVFINFLQISKSSYQLFISAGLVLDLILAGYLFLVKQQNHFLSNIFQKLSYLTGVFILVPVVCLSFILRQERWITLFVGLLLLNFLVDTAAFFSGKYFGKTKLWEKVSPKKTVEGLIGGVFFSVLVTSIYWNYLIAPIQWQLILMFAFMAVCSQVGDLLQSKLKREFEIKDSSSLIPGHGGVYDRIDSLLFVSPLYAALISYFYH
jgi:phosphatidate cytidylyltransferase